MSGYLYLAVQAYGDNVISLRLLQQLRGRVELRILGTPLTREIAGLIGFDAFPIDTLPAGPSAIYNVREAGLARAVGDFLLLRRALRARAGGGTTVLFENQRRPRTHRLLHLVAGAFPYDQPRAGRSAYGDRQRMLERAFGLELRLPPTALPAAAPRKVLVAPAARMGSRAFPAETVRHLLEYFGARGATVTLVDADGRHAALRGQAADYVGCQPLDASINRLRQADLVVAPDSLFLHLAYAVGSPVMALVPEAIARDFYFAPPGLVERGLFLSFDAARNRARLFDHVDVLLAQRATGRGTGNVMKSV